MRAHFAVSEEIERLIYQLPEEKIFKGQLSRSTSLIKAARRFQLFQVERHGPEFVLTTDEERSIFWLSDSHGNEVLISDCADRPDSLGVFRCVTHSVIARCALELWAQEQASLGGCATSLYRVPTRKELRECLCLDEPAVTKLCRREGFDWLPCARLAS